MHRFIERNVFFCMCDKYFPSWGNDRYNCPEIDDWFAQTRYETLLSVFREKGENFNLPSAGKSAGRLWFSLSI